MHQVFGCKHTKGNLKKNPNANDTLLHINGIMQAHVSSNALFESITFAEMNHLQEIFSTLFSQAPKNIAQKTSCGEFRNEL